LERDGGVKKIEEVATNAVATPFYAHKLNLSRSVSSKILIIEKASSVIKKVTFFFKHYTPKRNTSVLSQVLGKRLDCPCETRWVERHDIENLPEIVETLTKIGNWKDKNSCDKANVLLKALCHGEFLVGLFCLSDVLALTQPLSVILQKKARDLSKKLQTFFSQFLEL
jgi:hypothetical protein